MAGGSVKELTAAKLKLAGARAVMTTAHKQAEERIDRQLGALHRELSELRELYTRISEAAGGTPGRGAAEVTTPDRAAAAADGAVVEEGHGWQQQVCWLVI